MKTIDEVMKLKAELIKFYREMHRQQRIALEHFNGDFHVLSGKVREMKKFHEVLTIDARLMVENITAHVRPTKFSIRFEPLTRSEKSKEQAEQLGELVYALLHRWGTMKALSPFAEGAKNIAIYGMTGFRTLYDDGAWGEKPRKDRYESKEETEYRKVLWAAQRATRLPIVVNAIDPLNMLPAPARDHPRFMIEFCKMKPYLLKEDFPTWDWAGGDYTDVDLTTYFDGETWMYIVGNEKQSKSNLRPSGANPYGICPYTLAWSGLGKNSPDGLPEQRAVGLIYPLIPLIKEKSRSLTAASIILQATAIPRIWTDGAPEGGLNIGIAPGDVTELGGARFGFFDMAPVPSDLYNIIQIASQQMERFLGEKILSGQRPAGVTSALFEEILLEQAQRKYRTFIESMEAAYASVIAQSLFLIERFVKDPIPGIKIKPKDIRGFYQPEIRFQYEDIATKRIKAMVARMLFMSGLIDFQTAHGEEFLNTPNTSEVRKGLIKDKLYQDPSLIAAMAMDLAEEMGLGEMLGRTQERLYEGRKIGAVGGLPVKEEAALDQMLGSPESEKPLRTPESTGGGFGYGEGEGAGGE